MQNTVKFLTARNSANPVLQFLTPLLQGHQHNRLYCPVTLQDLELRDRLAYNRTSQLHSDVALGREEPILKVTLNECISEIAFNRKAQSFRMRYLEKIEKIVDTIYPLKETDEKNRFKLKAYLKTCVDFGQAMKNDDPEVPHLKHVAQFMYASGLHSHSLNLDLESVKTLLIMSSDEIKFGAFNDFLEKISKEFQKAFISVPQNQFKQLFLAMRHHTLPFLDSPDLNFEQASPVIAFPFKTFLAHSFEPYCKIQPYYEFSNDVEFIVLKSIRPIGIGEPLTINYENKSKVSRQL